MLTSPAQSLCLRGTPEVTARARPPPCLILATWFGRSPWASPMAQVHSPAGGSEKGAGPPRTGHQRHVEVCAETHTKPSLPYRPVELREQGCRESVHLQGTELPGRSASCGRWRGGTLT